MLEYLFSTPVAVVEQKGEKKKRSSLSEFSSGSLDHHALAQRLEQRTVPAGCVGAARRARA